MPLLSNLFDTDQLTPHGFCLSWDPGLLALHVTSDALIGLAYFSIPICLTVFLAKRRDLAFRWVFWLFAVFILACGTTHFVSIWTIWNPDYGLDGMIKAVTAVASVLTAAVLWPLVPRAVALPSPRELRATNELLRQQISERDAAERALRREVQERERTEAMLRQAQRMEAIGKLTGGVAHDFNNLLAAVTSNLELLESRLGDRADLRRYTGRALAAATRGGVLTQQLLAYAGRQALKPARVDVAQLVADMAELLRGSLGATIRLDLDLGDTEPADLWDAETDASQLASALLNLTINARDAMPEGGLVRIGIRNGSFARGGGVPDSAPPPGEYVVLTVVDTGVGMAPNVRANAFEPFFTTKPVGKGSGLGLSQVYGFVTQSGGYVRLDSDEGQGTTVTLFLPRAAD